MSLRPATIPLSLRGRDEDGAPEQAANRSKGRRPQGAEAEAPQCARTASHRSKPSPAAEEHEVARLNRELREAHEQQAATSEVLQVISSSPGDLEPVFAAMLEKAVRICDAKFGSVYRCDADTFRFVAMHNAPAALAEQTRHSLFRPSAKHYFGRMIATKAVTQVADLMAEPGYIDRRPEYVASVRTWRCTCLSDGADLKGARVDRRIHYGPTGSSPLH